MSTTRELITEHTREMVAAGMGYALAKLSEDPGWLYRMPRDEPLTVGLAPDADEFMKYRGNFAVESLAFDIESGPEEGND